MANNYTEATVEPMLPAALVTSVERDLLSHMGFDVHVYGTELYLTVDEHFQWEFDEWFKEAWEQEQGAPYAEQYETIIDIFHAIMSRTIESEEEEDIDEIVIKGAFTCSKKRPGEFGGFVVRITPDSFQEGSTDMLLEQFRGNGSSINNP